MPASEPFLFTCAERACSTLIFCSPLMIRFQDLFFRAKKKNVLERHLSFVVIFNCYANTNVGWIVVSSISTVWHVAGVWLMLGRFGQFHCPSCKGYGTVQFFAIIAMCLFAETLLLLLLRSSSPGR